MAHRNYPLNYTSADLEKAAVNRFRSLVVGLPQQCIVFRDLWDRSTVLCLDFADCPNSLEPSMSEFFPLLLAAHNLGLADSLLFKMNNRVMGWTTMAPNT
ncbi:MAG: hypothetical protein F6J86_14085 [Symploca sp. SIO1B1]|nr:hypothetical protein [Symploca sp. SIO2D2]NER21646.1 hypothetical protein [Symploca sp. SIO1C2]NER49163.1 hypothetical protein [Symploca sp. SIO1A3]NER94945.1 hypothetical protein [Symploca sp. SIO1B1]